MIVHAVQQGSPEWHALHFGIPSASNFHLLITAGGKPADNDGARGYMHRKLAEYFLREPCESAKTLFMDRGKLLEEPARAHYTLETGRVIEEVGFVTTDDASMGCSPDGFIGHNGIFEGKAYGIEHHIAALLAADKSHTPQIQGGMMICERAWTDRVYHYPQLPDYDEQPFPAITVRIERDDDYIAKLADALEAFKDKFEEEKEKLVKLGCVRCEPARRISKSDWDEHNRLLAELTETTK